MMEFSINSFIQDPVIQFNDSSHMERWNSGRHVAVDFLRWNRMLIRHCDNNLLNTGYLTRVTTVNIAAFQYRE